LETEQALATDDRTSEDSGLRHYLAKPLSAEPMPFDCERIVYSGVGCLITKEK
jgi:hypothetical protein